VSTKVHSVNLKGDRVISEVHSVNLKTDRVSLGLVSMKEFTR